jgi:hypothetical protein
MRAEISTGLWMVNNHVIEKIKLLAGKMVCKKGKRGPILTCACSHTFSLQLRRGVGSGSQLCLWAKISTVPWMVNSDVIEKIKLLAGKMV